MYRHLPISGNINVSAKVKILAFYERQSLFYDITLRRSVCYKKFDISVSKLACFINIQNFCNICTIIYILFSFMACGVSVHITFMCFITSNFNFGLTTGYKARALFSVKSRKRARALFSACVQAVCQINFFSLQLSPISLFEFFLLILYFSEYFVKLLDLFIININMGPIICTCSF